jgi:ABC transporter substrate binding protein
LLSSAQRLLALASHIAQQLSRVWRIWILHGVPAEASIGVAAFRQRLGELGYVEGQNSIIEYRWSDQMDRLPSFAEALTELKVDVIIAGDSTRAEAVKQATRESPIVAVFTDDPVAAGLIDSLGHPGANVHGTRTFCSRNEREATGAKGFERHEVQDVNRTKADIGRTLMRRPPYTVLAFFVSE